MLRPFCAEPARTPLAVYDPGFLTRYVTCIPICPPLGTHRHRTSTSSSVGTKFYIAVIRGCPVAARYSQDPDAQTIFGYLPDPEPFTVASRHHALPRPPNNRHPRCCARSWLRPRRGLSQTPCTSCLGQCHRRTISDTFFVLLDPLFFTDFVRFRYPSWWYYLDTAMAVRPRRT